MVELNISDYPQMKPEARKKLHRSIRKMAYPDDWKQEMDFGEFIKRMKGGRR